MGLEDKFKVSNIIDIITNFQNQKLWTNPSAIIQQNQLYNVSAFQPLCFYKREY